MNKESQGILELILDELKGLRQEVSIQGKILAKQEENLEIHIKRSDALEELIQLTKKELGAEIEPVKKHVIMVNGILKFVGGIGIIIGIATGVVEIIQFFIS